MTVEGTTNNKAKVTEMKRVLVFGGKTGWIGNLMCELMEKEGKAESRGNGWFLLDSQNGEECFWQLLLGGPILFSSAILCPSPTDGIEVFRANARLENREAVAAELDEIKPTHVLNAAGITGRPNIDWCETNKPETIRTNVIGTLNLADLCYIRDIHCTVYATGCIFVYDEKHPEGSGIGFTEEDKPNFDGSFYSQTKGYMEPMLKEFPNCLILRVRMPISDDLIHRSFVTKIVKYERVVNIPNSMTILTEMLPASLVSRATTSHLKDSPVCCLMLIVDFHCNI